MLPEIVRTAAFRLALGFIGAFAASTLLLFAFIYWQTAVFETRRIDRFVLQDLAALTAAPPDQLVGILGPRLSRDVHRLTFVALFDKAGHALAGNLASLPPDLPRDGKPHTASLMVGEGAGAQAETARAVARRLADGGTLVIARSVNDLDRLRRTVLRALGLSVIPATLLALAAGVFLSLRALRQVKDVHETMARILSGDLHERLPLRGTGDDFDRLSAGVNRMLDEIGRLLDQLKGIGNDIAHDLRTPLTRVRARLERARDAGGGAEALQEAIDRAVLGLDQTLGIITALLRIGEIEARRRRSGFAAVDLADIGREIEELYTPIAEEQGIAFTLSLSKVPPVIGDRDLLVEAVANLVGNAIKFTPPGGAVRLTLAMTPRGPALRVHDTGPGIPAEERAEVLKRFYRSDKSRHIEGSGLGLSLVAAIVELHGFRLTIADGDPGAVFELLCQPVLAA
uniref:histidine kinase n=1 Tax=Acidicaldus sp. TaxID=1872105 RepID=A0A8J4HAN0_9PROT